MAEGCRLPCRLVDLPAIGGALQLAVADRGRGSGGRRGMVVGAGTVRFVFVSDLAHVLDLSDTVPGPARKMAAQLTSIVRAATARTGGVEWVSALACARRPGRQRCGGHLVVRLSDVPAEIWWACSDCGDDGVIRGWERSPFDLRTVERLVVDDQVDVVVLEDDAVLLRSVMLADASSEALVYGAAWSPAGAVLTGTLDGLDELADSVAAEANHEPVRRRQRRLDAVFDGLQAALDGRRPS